MSKKITASLLFLTRQLSYLKVVKHDSGISWIIEVTNGVSYDAADREIEKIKEANRHRRLWLSRTLPIGPKTFYISSK